MGLKAGEQNSISKSTGQEGTAGRPDLEARQEKTGMKLEKYKRPNPEGPHIVIRSRALPDRQWGVFTHLAQWKTLLPFMIPFNCHLGKPFPELRRSSWICPPRSPGPLMPHPFISQIVLYSKE